VAGLLSFQPGEQIAQVLTLRDYEQSPYLVLATKAGLVKKTRLTDYDSPRQAGVIAVAFRSEGDALIGAALVSENDDLLLVTRKAQAIRFRADDEQLRPMGRSTSGVTGMKLRGDDELLSMAVVPGEGSEAEQAADSYVFTVTGGGYAKRTRVSEYRRQGRGGIGIKAMRVAEQRGSLVGALVVSAGDEVLAIKTSGQVTRSAVADVPVKGRDTMGVIFAGVKGKDSVVAVARNAEAVVDEADAETELSSTDTAEGAVSDRPASVDGTVVPEGDGQDGSAADVLGRTPEEPDGSDDADGTDAPRE
jgi:DNA gyrase subunit A